jgi:hypothetical protein
VNYRNDPYNALLRHHQQTDATLDEQNVKALRERIYADRKVDREEFGFVTDLNNAISERDNHHTWPALYTDTLCDYVLKDDQSPGEVDEREAMDLIMAMTDDGMVDWTETCALVHITDRAKKVHPALLTFTRSSLLRAICDDGVVDTDETDMLRRFIYGEGGDEGAHVSHSEMDLMCRVNDATIQGDNCPEWRDLFVKVTQDYVLDDPHTPGDIDNEEAENLWWLFMADGDLNSLEKRAINNLSTEVTGKRSKRFDQLVDAAK